MSEQPALTDLFYRGFLVLGNEGRIAIKALVLNDAVPDANFSLPPYRAEEFTPGGWSGVMNANGLNVLRFKSKPGACITDIETAKAIAKHWNSCFTSKIDQNAAAPAVAADQEIIHRRIKELESSVGTFHCTTSGYLEAEIWLKDIAARINKEKAKLSPPTRAHARVDDKPEPEPHIDVIPSYLLASAKVMLHGEAYGLVRDGACNQTYHAVPIVAKSF